MLRNTLCLLFTAAFVLAFSAFAVAQHTDVQSLQYEFGQPAPVAKPPAAPPCGCCVKPVVYAPVPRSVCAPYCTTTCMVCRPYYAPPACYPVPKKVVYRRTVVRPAYYPPRWYW